MLANFFCLFFGRSLRFSGLHSSAFPAPRAALTLRLSLFTLPVAHGTATPASTRADPAFAPLILLCTQPFRPSLTLSRPSSDSEESAAAILHAMESGSLSPRTSPLATSSPQAVNGSRYVIARIGILFRLPSPLPLLPVSLSFSLLPSPRPESSRPAPIDSHLARQAGQESDQKKRERERAGNRGAVSRRWDTVPRCAGCSFATTHPLWDARRRQKEGKGRFSFSYSLPKNLVLTDSIFQLELWWFLDSSLCLSVGSLVPLILVITK